MTEAVVETPASTPAAPAPAPTASAPVPTPSEPSTPASPAPAPAGSLMAKGAAPSPAPAPAAAPASPIPEKFLVKREDGTVDSDASMAKMGEAYSQLEKRLGGGDAPPAKPEDYAPTLPDGLTMEQLKTDPMFSSFLKGAHARGMSNADVSFVLEAYQQRVALSASPEVGEAELRKVWTTDDQMTRGLADCFRATQAFSGGDQELASRLDRKFGNDPDFIRLMAQVGRELHEDHPPAGTLTQGESETLAQLMASPAYFDAKHPEHAVTVARVSALYKKRTGEG